MRTSTNQHHGEPPPSPDELASMGYERRDVNLKGITKVILIFFGFALFSWVASYFYLRLYGAGYTENQLPNAGKMRKIPALPNPLLQNNVTAKSDIFEMRQSENAVLGGYNYTNKQAGMASIPIERAKEMLLSEGVSVGADMAAKTTGNQTDEIRQRAVTQSETPVPAGASGGGVPDEGTQIQPSSAGR